MVVCEHLSRAQVIGIAANEQVAPKKLEAQSQVNVLSALLVHVPLFRQGEESQGNCSEVEVVGVVAVVMVEDGVLDVVVVVVVDAVVLLVNVSSHCLPV